MTTQAVCCMHPDKPALWFCPKCRQMFCSDCIVKLDGGSISRNKTIRFCPKCTVPTRRIGGTETGKNWWQKLSRFFLPKRPEIEAEEGGSQVEHFPTVKKITAENPIAAQLKNVDELCRDGRIDDAITLIQQWREKGGALNKHMAERYFELLKKAQRTQEMIAHAPAYLGLVIETGNKVKALEIYETSISADPKFAADPKIMFKIGEWLSDAGKPKEAIKVFSSLTKNHPEAPEVPMSFFHAAKIYHDQLKDEDRAKKILEQLIQKYPEHKMMPKFKTYLDHIK